MGENPLRTPEIAAQSLRYARRLLGWRFVVAVVVAAIYTGWGGYVVKNARQLQATVEQRQAWLHELQHAEHQLLSHHPEDPEIREAFARILRVAQVLPDRPGWHGDELAGAVEDLRTNLQVPGERARARSALLEAIHQQTHALFGALEGLAQRVDFRWRQLQYLAISAVALAALAILAMLLARYRRLAAEHLGQRLEGAIREADSARHEAQRANQAKSRFLATVSHELRTPMTAILGTVDLLGRTDLSSRQADYLTAIRSSGETLQRLIDDVLDLSRIEAGHLELVDEPFRLDELFEALAHMFGGHAEQAGLELVLHCGSAIPVERRGDSFRLRQVLVNLIGNACKFTDQGSVELRIAPSADDPDALTFAVQDTGQGLAPGQRARIFQPFTQADSSLTRTHGGAGLGLAICRRLVEAMGGELEVESELGTGSTFSFTATLPAAVPPPERQAPGPMVLLGDSPPLQAVARQLDAWGLPHRITADEAQAAAWLSEAPMGTAGTLLLDATQPRLEHPAMLTWRVLRLVPFSAASGRVEPGVTRQLVGPVRPGLVASLLDPQRDRAPTQDAAPSPSFASHRVLIVDDNEMNRLVLAEMLVTLGCRVTLASGGEQALGCAADQDFDLVFMDSEMPVMDGFETTRRLRETGLDPARTPILGLSGHVTPEHRQQGLDAGMSDYLSKPIQLTTLEAAVQRWCEQRER